MTRSHRWPLVLCALVVVAAGCGTRLSRSEIVSSNTVRGAQAEASGSDAAVAGDDEPTGPGATTEAEADASAPGASDAGGGSTGPAEGPTGGSTGATGAPIIFGLLNNETGVGANVTLPVRQVWQAWAKTMNAKGGINGHPIQILVADCANNTSLNLPSARDLVEKRGAIALAFECGEITGVPEYALQKRIPVIGSLVGHAEWNTNPMLFPTKPNSGGIAKANGLATKQLGVKKVAILYCVEAPTCKNGADAYAAAVEANGLQVVYKAGTTVTQPDYTSECLQARNAGADFLSIGGLPDQAIRVARSCARQQYKPTYSIAPASDAQTAISELDGAVTLAGAFPWFLHSGSPALDEYGQALAKYAPKLVKDGTSLQTDGWISAKVLERAIELGVKADNPKPTSQDILNGLWGMKADDLDGLSLGPLARTYVRDQPTPDTACTFSMKLSGGKWSAPNGVKPACA